MHWSIIATATRWPDASNAPYLRTVSVSTFALYMHYAHVKTHLLLYAPCYKPFLTLGRNHYLYSTGTGHLILARMRPKRLLKIYAIQVVNPMGVIPFIQGIKPAVAFIQAISAQHKTNPQELPSHNTLSMSR